MKRAVIALRAGSRAGSRWLVFVLIAWALALMAPPARAADPAQGPGGPILVVTSGPSTHGTYYAEILRTEGFNAFQVADIGAVTPTTLAGYDVVLLAKMLLTALATQATNTKANTTPPTKFRRNGLPGVSVASGDW